METQTKTPVNLVQELIAIHTTRKEAVEKFSGQENPENLTSDLTAAGQQSDKFIAELMSELSNFGDAVQAEVDRENDYQLTWKNTLGAIDTMNEQEKSRTFEQMEQNLKKFYQTMLDTSTELPVSLQDILQRQMKEL